MQITKNYYCLVLSCLVAISLSATWGPGGWGGLSQEPGMQGRGMGDQSFGHPCLPASLPLPPAVAPYHMCSHTSFETQA